jgi:hypothetical protein
VAELLVRVATGEVLHVAEDGHAWGCSESRQEWDRRVAAGDPPRHIEREVRVVERVLDEEHDIRIAETEPIEGTDRLVDTPPPSRLGIVRIPGAPVRDYLHLTEREVLAEGTDDERAGEKLHRLDLREQLSESDVLARTVEVDGRTVEQRTLTRAD